MSETKSVSTTKSVIKSQIIRSGLAPSEELVDSYFNEQRLLTESLSSEFSDLRGEDPAFKIALLNAQKAAVTDLPVLIIGETGTGKEFLARAIHFVSQRGKNPFVDINCAAIPDNLFESELFGYERGAFTGARPEGKKGLFEQAHKGTLFMDEIGDASLQSQAKVLRVLQESCFKKVGSLKTLNVDVRLISATNKNLSDLIDKQNFRDDLFYRINTITINLPPLRLRKKDIPILVDYFLAGYTSPQGQDLIFTPESMALLNSYEWPGNVRELKGVVDYAATMATSSILTPNSLPSFLKVQGSSEPPEAPSGSTIPESSNFLKSALMQVEETVIRKVLERSKTKTEAIKILGISRRTFYKKIEQYNLMDSLKINLQD